jgi:hypothetical protein
VLRISATIRNIELLLRVETTHTICITQVHARLPQIARLGHVERRNIPLWNPEATTQTRSPAVAAAGSHLERCSGGGTEAHHWASTAILQLHHVQHARHSASCQAVGRWCLNQEATSTGGGGDLRERRSGEMDRHRGIVVASAVCLPRPPKEPAATATTGKRRTVLLMEPTTPST